MPRFFVFALLFLGSIALASWVTSRIRYTVDSVSFFVGLSVAMLTGLAWFMINGWWTAVRRPFQPMVIRLETEQTPAQVNFRMFVAIVQGILVAGGLFVVIVLMLSSS
jgi:hypothetical protein